MKTKRTPDPVPRSDVLRARIASTQADYDRLAARIAEDQDAAYEGRLPRGAFNRLNRRAAAVRYRLLDLQKTLRSIPG